MKGLPMLTREELELLEAMIRRVIQEEVRMIVREEVEAETAAIEAQKNQRYMEDE